jgi:hypothetical protein
VFVGGVDQDRVTGPSAPDHIDVVVDWAHDDTMDLNEAVLIVHRGSAPVRHGIPEVARQRLRCEILG